MAEMFTKNARITLSIYSMRSYRFHLSFQSKFHYQFGSLTLRMGLFLHSKDLLSFFGILKDNTLVQRLQCSIQENSTNQGSIQKNQIKLTRAFNSSSQSLGLLIAMSKLI